MKKIAFLLALVMLFTVVGCTSKQGDSKADGTTKSAESSTKASTEAPAETSDFKEIDVLRIGCADLPSHMDPARNVGNVGIRIHYNIFETLLLADQKDDFRIKPMLASEWKRIDDYTLELTLKKGIKFHNGDEVKAKDIAYSFERLHEDLAGIDLARSLLSVITEVQVVDDYTVRLITDVVDPILEDRIASSWGGWIVPADYIEEVGNEEFARKPIGTGPYKVVSYSPDRIVLERFEDFWGEKPAAKTIEYIKYPETSARIIALINGEVDIITQVPPDQIHLIENEPNVDVISTVISNMHVLTINTTTPPLTDKKLRQALCLAIDRQLLVDTLWDGKAVVPRGHQYPEYGDLYFADYPLCEYNPEKAKQLVEESSYNGEEIIYEVRHGYYTFGTEAAEAIVDMWKAIGVNAKIQFVEKYTRDMVSNWSNTMRFPDPAGGLWLLWGPESAAKTNYWQDMPEEFLETGYELVSILDPERRKELSLKLMQIFEDEAPCTTLYYPFESWGIRKGLEWQPYSSQTMDFRADNFKVLD